MDSAYSVQRFVSESREKGTAGERFEAESERMLRIDVDGGVWLKPGAAIAYRGDLTFERRATLDARSVQDAALREAAPLVRAVGTGRLYCAHRGSHVRIVRLAGETIVVVWQELLAFEQSLAFEARLVGHGIGITAGGLVAVTLSGSGALAMAVHGQPLTLPIVPGDPVCTDPHATIAWWGDVTPSLKTDVSWRSALGHGGQEPFQIEFDGTGFVVVQPHKDPSRVAVALDPFDRVKSLITSSLA